MKVMPDLPPAKTKMVVNVQVHKASELLKALQAKGSDDSITIRIEAGKKAELIKRLGGDIKLSRLVKSLIDAYLLSSEARNINYLNIIALTPEDRVEENLSYVKTRIEGGENHQSRRRKT